MNETLRTGISGTAGGMASILAVHPLDTVRTRLQAAPAGAYRGAWHCARVTVRREGPLALYKGLAWPLAAQGLYKAVMFGVYGAASRALRGGDPARPLAAHEVFAAGGVAGGANALVLAPVELVRNRFQVAAGRTTLRAVLREAAAAGGVYRGLGATLLRDVPGVGVLCCLRGHAAARGGAPGLAEAGAYRTRRRGRGRRRGVLDRGAAAGLREDAPAGRRRGGLGVGRGRAPGRGARGRAPAGIRRLRVRARARRAGRGGRL